MKKMIEQLEDVLRAAFSDCGYEERFGMLSVSNRPDLCQYQCNGAMAAAKQYKKAPIVIAGEIAEKCSSNPMFKKFEAVMPGFINITISDSFLAGMLRELSQEERLGCAEESPKSIVIDYGGPNVAKPLHVGHLRSAIIGESVKRLKRFMGDRIVGDIHLGDWGLQMGLIIEELRDRRPELVYFQEGYTGEYPEQPPFTLAELEEIYPAASSKSKEDDNFKERAHRAILKIQQEEPAYTALWKHIMSVSIPDLRRNYDNLDVHFESWKGESDAKPYIADMIDDLVKRGVAYESQGALVVDIAEESDSRELPPCLVRKSDGAAIYATSDLATILDREKLYQPDQYIYLADKRQELHFTQIFRTAKKAGYVSPETKMDYIGFGTMNGKDGKPFKTREGGVMRLEYLMRDVEDAVYARIMENRTMEEEEAHRAAKTIGLAAVKYGDLSNQASKDYVFDIDRFTAFEGNTGPYILYTMVRIKSILAKYAESRAAGADAAGKSSASADSGSTAVQAGTEAAALREYSAAETELMLAATRVTETIERAAQELAPHRLCQYIYELSNAFNSFYHENKILAEEDKAKQAQWITLITLTLRILETCTGLLGFQAPERM